MEQREPIRWFAERMEYQLRNHDERGATGWRDAEVAGCRLGWLFQRCEEELEEARKAAVQAQRSGYTLGVDEAIDEFADAANFCMMLADVLRQRCKQVSAPPAELTEETKCK